MPQTVKLFFGDRRHVELLQVRRSDADIQTRCRSTKHIAFKARKHIAGLCRYQNSLR